MTKLNICIDIDGTVTDPYHFIPYLNEMYNKNLSAKDCITHKLEELYEVSIEELLQEFHTSYIHSYKEASVVEGAKDIIHSLNDIHNLCFVTARSEILKEYTVEWLQENEFPSIEVHLLGSDNKVPKAQELSCNLFIEDNPDNATQLANAGIKVLLIETNYNKHISQNDNIIKVRNWNDINEYISNF